MSRRSSHIHQMRRHAQPQDRGGRERKRHELGARQHELGAPHDYQDFMGQTRPVRRPQLLALSPTVVETDFCGHIDLSFPLFVVNKISLPLHRTGICASKSQASKLGDAPVGIPPFFFNDYRLVSVEPKFLLLHMMCAILGMPFYFVLLNVLIKYLYLKVL